MAPRIRSLAGVRDRYARKILNHVLNKDPLKVLTATPGALRGLVRRSPAVKMGRALSPGKWSVRQLVCHMADTEIVLSFRLRMVLAESGRPIQATNEGKWAARLGYKSANIHERVRFLSSLRAENVKLLRSLSGAEWKRYGYHEERGKETVARMAQLYAGHDLNHLAQVRAILSRRD